MDFDISVLPGDGIGTEVTAQGVNALEAVGRVFGHNFRLEYGDVGGISIDKHGTPLLPSVRDAAAGADAVLFGGVGGPKWDNPDASMRPEDALLQLRAHLGVIRQHSPGKGISVAVRLQRVEAFGARRCGPGSCERVDRRAVLRPAQGAERDAPGLDGRRHYAVQRSRGGTHSEGGVPVGPGSAGKAGFGGQSQRAGVLQAVAPDSYPVVRRVPRRGVGAHPGGHLRHGVNSKSRGGSTS